MAAVMLLMLLTTAADKGSKLNFEYLRLMVVKDIGVLYLLVNLFI